jgi:hypothetical protein
MAFDSSVPEWLSAEELTLQAEREDGLRHLNSNPRAIYESEPEELIEDVKGQLTNRHTEFHRSKSGSVRMGAVADFSKRERADSTLRKRPLPEVVSSHRGPFASMHRGATADEVVRAPEAEAVMAACAAAEAAAKADTEEWGGLVRTQSINTVRPKSKRSTAASSNSETVGRNEDAILPAVHGGGGGGAAVSGVAGLGLGRMGGSVVDGGLNPMEAVTTLLPMLDRAALARVSLAVQQLVKQRERETKATVATDNTSAFSIVSDEPNASDAQLL